MMKKGPLPGSQQTVLLFGKSIIEEGPEHS
jgi:hypothetical protein